MEAIAMKIEDNKNDICEKAVVVDLTISCWVGKTTDVRGNDAVSSTYGVKETRGNYVKFLVPKERLNELKKLEQRLRNMHRKNTLPWGDRGERLLPTKNYFRYMEKIEKARSEWEKAVDKFIDEYNDLVEQSRVELGHLFNPNDYPSESEIRSYFGISIDVFPIPTTDFRVSLGGEEVERMRNRLEQLLQKRFEAASKDLVIRMMNVVKKIKDRLTDPEAERFRKSMFEAANDIVEIVESLNVSDDPELNRLATEIRDVFGGVNVDEIKENPDTKKKVAEDAAKILEKIKKYMN
jgi:hypothetical protein